MRFRPRPAFSKIFGWVEELNTRGPSFSHKRTKLSGLGVLFWERARSHNKLSEWEGPWQIWTWRNRQSRAAPIFIFRLGWPDGPISPWEERTLRVLYSDKITDKVTDKISCCSSQYRIGNRTISEFRNFGFWLAPLVPISPFHPSVFCLCDVCMNDKRAGTVA